MNFRNIPMGSPEQFNVLIEIPTGSINKYEIDEETGFVRLSFVFKDGLHYPFNYGFVPYTLAEDKDPLDAIVLSSAPIYPNTVVAVKPIAILKLKDRGVQDNKLITVAIADPMAATLNDINDLTEIQKEGFKEFFRQVGIQKNKSVEIEDIFDRAEAMAEVKKCMI